MSKKLSPTQRDLCSCQAVSEPFSTHVLVVQDCARSTAWALQPPSSLAGEVKQTWSKDSLKIYRHVCLCCMENCDAGRGGCAFQAVPLSV